MLLDFPSCLNCCPIDTCSFAVSITISRACQSRRKLCGHISALGRVWCIPGVGNEAGDVLVASSFSVRGRIGTTPVWTLVLGAEVSSWSHPTGFLLGQGVWVQAQGQVCSHARWVWEGTRSTLSHHPNDKLFPHTAELRALMAKWP